MNIDCREKSVLLRPFAFYRLCWRRGAFLFGRQGRAKVRRGGNAGQVFTTAKIVQKKVAQCGEHAFVYGFSVFFVH